MKKLAIFSVLILAMALSANKCDDKDGVIRNKKGTIVDYNNLDGCTFIIELDNGTKLEPIEVVPVFRFESNQRVKVSYEIMEGVASTCMVGELVKVTEIETIN